MDIVEDQDDLIDFALDEEEEVTTIEQDVGFLPVAENNLISLQTFALIPEIREMTSRFFRLGDTCTLEYPSLERVKVQGTHKVKERRGFTSQPF
jgi:hypothetical protein